MSLGDSQGQRGVEPRVRAGPSPMRIRGRTLALLTLTFAFALTLGFGVGIRLLGADQRAGAQAALDQAASSSALLLEQSAIELGRAGSGVLDSTALAAWEVRELPAPDSALTRAGRMLDVDAALLIDATGPRWARAQLSGAAPPKELPAALLEHLRHAAVLGGPRIFDHEGHPWLAVPAEGADARLRLVLARRLDAGRLAALGRVARARVELRAAGEDPLAPPGDVLATAGVFTDVDNNPGWLLVLHRGPFDAERFSTLLALLGGNLTLLALAVGGVVLLIVDRMVLQRLSRFASLASRLSEGAAHGVRLPDTGANDELDRLAAAMNTTLDRVEANAAQLRHDALHDPLTGLANRVLFSDRLEMALARARRAESAGVAVLFIDLDRLKAINDQLGHDAGDHYITEAARRLMSAVRPGDTVSRFGGDEFAVIFADGLDQTAALRRGQAVLELLRLPLPYKGREHPVSASIGLAMAGPEHDAERVIREADVAMYSAKAGGRDRLAVFDAQLQVQLSARTSMESLLRRALLSGELDVSYQPIVASHDLRLVGAEALARWRTEDGRDVEPARFLAVAFDFSLATQLDHYVLHRALAAARRLREVHPNAFVSVNFSSRTLDEADVVLSIRQALAAEELPGEALLIELREGTLGRRESRWLPHMRELAAMGVRFALDDFGLGETPVARLVDLPVQVLKIETELVRDLGNGGGGVALGLIGLARALGRTVIAKGVERDTERRRLVEAGCPLIQGYLPGHPEPIDALLRRPGPDAPLADA